MILLQGVFDFAQGLAGDVSLDDSQGCALV